MYCPVCNRPLKSKESIAKGIVPVCEAKLKKMKNEAPENQIMMELKVK
ncbi:DUF6011 domain-containing protein [Peribacillus muralis]|nr:DUF6011 domain-containing protein [Peribacillus muralis]